MAAPLRLKQTLLGLPTLELRSGWLNEYLEATAMPRVARELDALCESTERGDLRAREAAYPLVLLVLHDPARSRWAELRAEAIEERLLSLERLLRFGYLQSNVRDTPGEAPVPDYGAGRELTVGERRSLARRSPREQIDRLLSDPNPMVLKELLRNPRLTEDDLVRLAARRPARVPVLLTLLRAPRWLKSERLRLSVLFNPGAPDYITVPMTALCSRRHLREIIDSPQLSSPTRMVALERLERLPPFQAAESALLH